MKQRIYYDYRENKDLNLFELFITDADFYDNTNMLGGISNEIIVFLIDDDIHPVMNNYFVTESSRHEILTTLASLEVEEDIHLFRKTDLLDADVRHLEVYYVVQETPDSDDDTRLITVVPKQLFDQHGHLGTEYNPLIEKVLEHHNIDRLSESFFESCNKADVIRLILNDDPNIKFIESPELLAFLGTFRNGGK